MGGCWLSSVTGLNFFSTPTGFRGQDLLPLLPGIRSEIAARFGNGTDPSVRGIEVIKQGDQVVDPDSTTAYAIHVMSTCSSKLSKLATASCKHGTLAKAKNARPWALFQRLGRCFFGMSVLIVPKYVTILCSTTVPRSR
jgi:hypothetical protein